MDEARFKPGDQVFVHDNVSNFTSDRIWTVDADDTNATPVVDNEPAYKLRRTDGRGQTRIRYAYQSNMTAFATGASMRFEQDTQEWMKKLAKAVYPAILPSNG